MHAQYWTGEYILLHRTETPFERALLTDCVKLPIGQPDFGRANFFPDYCGSPPAQFAALDEEYAKKQDSLEVRLAETTNPIA